MNWRTLVLTAALLAGSVFPLAQPADAIRAGELQGLRILSHHWTTRIASRERATTVNDPDAVRFLVLKLASNVQDKAVVFAPDFVLVYRHADGNEDRATCDAMGGAETEEPGEFGDFFIGSVPRLERPAGPLSFGVAFIVEADVESVEVHRIGGSPLSYRIGPDRPFSVYLSTNQPPELLARARRIAEAGGLQVTNSSSNLDAERTGTAVFYSSAAEAQARDLAARLESELGVSPDLQPLDLIAEVDIVVWLGR